MPKPSRNLASTKMRGKNVIIVAHKTDDNADVVLYYCGGGHMSGVCPSNVSVELMGPGRLWIDALGRRMKRATGEKKKLVHTLDATRVDASNLQANLADGVLGGCCTPTQSSTFHPGGTTTNNADGSGGCIGVRCKKIPIRFGQCPSTRWSFTAVESCG